MVKRISTPLTKEKIKLLAAGDKVLISGIIYTARDQAHLRMIKDMANLPFDLKGAIIYYAGPSPTKPGNVIGSIGPTTSCRMDSFTPLLLDKGLLGMIGKGKRDDAVIKKIKEHGAIYFVAGGGFGALLAQAVKSVKVVAYKELKSEAVRRLEVVDFPVIVGIDSYGKSIVS